MPSAAHDDHVDTAVGGADDALSGLPDDVLLDMLQRLVTAGDVHTAARTCILSRQWRHVPRYQIPDVRLDVADFYTYNYNPADGWCPAALARAAGRPRDWCLPYQRRASEDLVMALWFFVAAPPSVRVIDTLRLKMFLTSYEVLRRAGRLVGESARSGRIKDGGAVELELLVERGNLDYAPPEVMLGYGARFTQFLRGCPRAFRALTRLAVENLWFKDKDAVTDLVRRCRALEHLTLRCCGFEDPLANLVVDAPPESRLSTLLCIECDVPGVALVRAPSLIEFHCGWRLVGGPPASFGCTPALKKLTLDYHPYYYEDDDDDLAVLVGWRLSDFLLLQPHQLQVLTLSFQASTKIWVRPEMPVYLRLVLSGLTELRLENVHPACDLSWAIFLLGAARNLETLHIEVFNHVCDPIWHDKVDEGMDPDTMYLPPPGFKHRHLKEVTIRRAFHVARDVTFARAMVEMAVNLEKLTLGVEDLGCDKCVTTEARLPVMAKSRFRYIGASKDVDMLVERVRGGVTTSARVIVLGL